LSARAAAGAAGVIILAAVCLVGCSSAPSQQSTASPLAATGPWADEFRTAYADAKSDFERTVLVDSEITSAEYEQSKNHLRACLADANLTITWDDRGGFELGSKRGDYPDDFFERSDPVLRQCEMRWTGAILYLYEQIRRNPLRQDESALQIACLKGGGLIDETYTKEQWRRDNENDSLPFDRRGTQATRCELDPLGLWFAG
jgi:hypothetical protein